jgi:sugar phosphate isomerase/epimerase
MLTNGTGGTGISAHKRRPDLADFGDELDMIEALGVETIELPTYDMDIVVGGRIRRPQLEALKRATSGRGVTYTAHGPLGINFMLDAWRLPRHLEVLEASLDVAAEVGAVNYVIHAGLKPVGAAAGIEDAYLRQRDYLARGGDLARDRGIALCVECLFGDYKADMHTASMPRLAAELKAIDHPAVFATIDFSHGYLELSNQPGDFMEGVLALAPHARHLHIHDSFGRPDDTWMFTEGERLAFGHGDLHLPVGWGNIPWDEIVSQARFAPGVIFNIELKERYWYAAQEAVDATKALAARALTSSAA